MLLSPGKEHGPPDLLHVVSAPRSGLQISFRGKLGIGGLHRYHGDAQVPCKCSPGRHALPWTQLSGQDILPDLPVQILIERLISPVTKIVGKHDPSAIWSYKNNQYWLFL